MGTPQMNPAWTCRGKVYNDVKPEISNDIFVSDSYVKQEAIDWLRDNIKNYKFVGAEARNIKRRIIATQNALLQENEKDILIHDFFALLINNPFCTEAGIGISEKTYIVGKYLHCYFVQFKQNFMIPLGALERFVHEQIYSLQDEFVSTTREHAMKIYNDASSLIQTVEKRIQHPSDVQVATSVRAMFSVIIFVCSLLHVIYCACNIEWRNVKYILPRTRNIFQGLDFVSAKGFGLNHNDSLLSILMILGLFWTVFLLFNLRKVFHEVKHAMNYSKLHVVEKKIQYLGKYFAQVREDIVNGAQFIANNKQKSEDIFVATNTNEKRFGPKIQKVENHKDVQFSDKMKRAMPNTLWLCILLVLALGTFVLSTKSRSEEFVVAFRESQYKIQNANLKAKACYSIVAEGDLYAKRDETSVVLYHAMPGTKCRILDWDGSEVFFKVSVMTECGRVKGWIAKAAVAAYNPYNDGTVERLNPIECTASSEFVGEGNYGASNVLDGNLTTSWLDGDYGSGEGEWIQFKYDSQKPISTMGIFNGNGIDEASYFVNSRPTKILITFYREGIEVEHLKYELSSERCAMQYFDLNKDVNADCIRIEVLDTESGDMYEEMSIAEIEVFGTKVIVE